MYVWAKVEIDCLPISDVLAAVPTKTKSQPPIQREWSRVGCEGVQT